VNTIFGRPRRGPIAVALVLAAPLFFAGLLAATLAVEHPHVVKEWINHAFWADKSSTHPVVAGRTFRQWVLQDPQPGNEALIWACAAVLVAIMAVVGMAASFLRRGGTYVSCLTGIVLALLLRVRLDEWVQHHTGRFPYGVDNVFDGSPSSQVGRGEWEVGARQAIHSIGNVTIGFAVVIMLIYAVLHVRRVRALARALSPQLDEAETPATALERQHVH
jgi:hypothetical protein